MGHSHVHASKKNPIFKWFTKLHKHHHSCNANDMIPFDAQRMHPSELILTAIGICTGPMLASLLFKRGFHPFVSMCFYARITLAARTAHTGYVSPDGGAHVLHHQRSNCNYGVIGVWDYLLKTKQSKSVSLMYRLTGMYRNMKKKLRREEMDNVLSTLSLSQRNRSYRPNERVVRMGDPAESFFILEGGSCSAIVPSANYGSDAIVKEYNEPGQYFGELSLLRGEPRATTIRAGPAGCSLAEVPSKDFFFLSEITSIFEKNAGSYDDNYEGSLIEDYPFNVAEYSSLMPQEEYEPGQIIIKQGDKNGDKMYILEGGNAAAFIDGKEVFAYKEEGEYFGELALLYNQPRKASVVAGDLGAMVAVVNRSVFDRMVAIGGDSMRQHAREMYTSPK